MSHSDELARLRDAVVEAAKAERALQLAPGPMSFRERLHRRIPLEVSLKNAVDALLAAEALTCGKCEGRGWKHDETELPPYRAWVKVTCADCGGTGKKP